MVDIAGPRLPDLLTVDRVQRDGLVIERVEDDLPVGIDGTTVDNVATRDPLRGRVRVGLISPFQRRGGLLEAESVEVIRIGRHDVHRAANDDRSRLVSLGQTGRKREGKPEIGGIAHVDLVERAESRARVVFRWMQPLAIVAREPAGNSRHAGPAAPRARGGRPDRVPDCTPFAASVEYEKSRDKNSRPLAARI